ncbi:HipA domain-containing protein [Skermanella sp. TT6]|uniref:HipA domain-containing protein n=1 Tax=Skermanella cutis TaxID=2775420 RepID=A0ABX7B4S6_9PROT|nr:HipA domain-containing protein [Skermanella sp. TT6]
MSLAGAMGLITARSQVLRFEDEIAIVVERHDRRWTGTGFLRVHQEDICQSPGACPDLEVRERGRPRCPRRRHPAPLGFGTARGGHAPFRRCHGFQLADRRHGCPCQELFAADRRSRARPSGSALRHRQRAALRRPRPPAPEARDEDRRRVPTPRRRCASMAEIDRGTRP